MHRFRIFIAGLIACVMAVAGGLASPALAHGKLGPYQAGKVEGYPSTTVLWPIAPIPTCWNLQVQDFNNYAVERAIVQKAVADTWEAVSLIRFTGWDRCTGADNQGISIVIADENPGTYGLGTTLKNKNRGIDLNFELVQWPCVPKAECIRKIAIHEFGHVLGFAHEQLRDDKAPDCTKGQPVGDIPGDKKFGPWDAQSVMNYCNPEWNNGGNLSPGDIRMVKYYYGDPDPVPDFDMTPVTYLLLN